MMLHAISYEQKKAQAFHIVNGTVCKDCFYFAKITNFNECWLAGKVVNETDFCSDFKRKQST